LQKKQQDQPYWYATQTQNIQKNMLLAICLGIFLVGILMVPSVFADHLSDLEVEVKSQTDIGIVMIEKSEYRIAPREVVYVKVFGEVDMDNPVNHPIDYTQFLTFETTKPDGTKFITQVNKNQSGYFENPIPISYDTRGDSLSPFGQYQVYVTFKGNSLGNLIFSVVDKAAAEAADQAAAEAAAAAQAAAEVRAAEAKEAAQAAAAARVAAQAAAEVAAAEARAAAEAKAAASQAAATIIVLAIIATIIVVIAIMARKSRKNQIDQIKQTNDAMSANNPMGGAMPMEHNQWRNKPKSAKEEPKEEEGVTFCSDCGNRLTKAGAKFCPKCGSVQ